MNASNAHRTIWIWDVYRIYIWIRLMNLIRWNWARAHTPATNLIPSLRPIPYRECSGFQCPHLIDDYVLSSGRGELLAQDRPDVRQNFICSDATSIYRLFPYTCSYSETCSELRDYENYNPSPTHLFSNRAILIAQLRNTYQLRSDTCGVRQSTKPNIILSSELKQ